MPHLSVWFIQSALLHLALGFSFGALILWNKGAPFDPLVWRLLPAHIEFLLFGWIGQLGLGVAYWILPRFQTRRGNTTLAWLAWGLLNGGVWLVGLSSLMATPAVIGLAGRLAETSAVLAFVAHGWPGEWTRPRGRPADRRGALWALFCWARTGVVRASDYL